MNRRTLLVILLAVALLVAGELVVFLHAYFPRPLFAGYFHWDPIFPRWMTTQFVDGERSTAVSDSAVNQIVVVHSVSTQSFAVVSDSTSAVFWDISGYRVQVQLHPDSVTII